MNAIQNSFFETMKAFTDNAESNSAAAITVEAVIKEITDSGSGEYSISYMEGTYTAHADANMTYSVGDKVYVLVPNRDFSKNLLILGLYAPSAEVFVSDSDSGKTFYDVSENLLKSYNSKSELYDTFSTIKLSSYATSDSGDIPITNINPKIFGKTFKEYLTQHKTIALSFYAQTSMLLEQQNSGDYGVILKIPLTRVSGTDGHSPESFIKEITLNVDKMLGNPYRLTVWTPQVIYDTIDEQFEYDDSKVPTLSYYCKNFPQNAEKAKTIKDIWLKDLNFYFADELSTEDMQGYHLSLKATEGQLFSKYYQQTKTIVPTLRINGKVTKLSNNSAEVYWFREDVSIKPENKYYVNYGGYGWKCLNKRTNVVNNSDGGETFDWVTHDFNLDVNQIDVKSSARYKCVVLYKNVQVSSIITLKNLNVSQYVGLAALGGVDAFIKDTGYAHLVATVYADGVTSVVDSTGKVNMDAMEKNRGSITYSWLRKDKYGNIINDEGKTFKYTNQDGKLITSTSFFEVVRSNQIVQKEFKGSMCYCFETEIMFPMNTVEDFNLVYCTAKHVTEVNDKTVDSLIGTEQLTVATSEDFTYGLTVNGDGVIYKYDTDGDSPAGTAYDGPSTSKIDRIEPLTYTITKADGTELTNEEYCYVRYVWMVPKDSLFSVSSYPGEKTNTPYPDIVPNPSNQYDYYQGYDNYNHAVSLKYNIASRFNMVKANKAIILKTAFQNSVFEQTVDISFMKEGMSGSNGTAYAARLVSGGSSASSSVAYGTIDMQTGVAQKLKFLYNSSDGGVLYRHDYTKNTLVTWNEDNSNSYKCIFPRVWENSEEIRYSSATRHKDATDKWWFDYKNGGTTVFEVEWTMFDEKSTNPCFSIYRIDSNGGVVLKLKKDVINKGTNNYCTILQGKITVNAGNSSVANAREILYVYYPIEITITNFKTSVIPTLNGGFSEVMYASDGTNPSWDETADFIVNDDDILKKDLGEMSKYFSTTWSSQYHLTVRPNGSRATIKPDNKYDDGNSSNFIKATLSFNTAAKAGIENELYNKVGTYPSSTKPFNDNCENSLAAKEKAKAQAAFTRVNGVDSGYLVNFAKAYDLATWRTHLKYIQDLLDKQTDAANKINSLMDASAAAMQEYLKLQEEQDKLNFVTYCRPIYDKMDILIGTPVKPEGLAKKALTQIQILNGTTGRDVKDLVSLKECLIGRLYPETMEYIDWVTYVGAETARNLELLKEDLNNQIMAYETELQDLQKIAVDTQEQLHQSYMEAYRKVIDSIYRTFDTIPNDAYPQFVEMRNHLYHYAIYFDECTSITDLEQLIDGMYDIIKNTYSLQGDKIVLDEAVKHEYEVIALDNQLLIDYNNALEVTYKGILETSGRSLVHIRPIVLYFNRYEMSNLNAWDGNKTEVKDGYITTPQIGAGIKEADNSFTGVVMGLKKITAAPADSQNRKGLFGYKSGTQTFLLDAENGAAIFGKSGSGGQIIIDPSSASGTDGAIFSSNYFKADAYDKATGLPKDIGSNKSGEGMLLNFSKGVIHLGGATTYDGGDVKKPLTGYLYSGTHTYLHSVNDGFYLDSNGLSIGSGFVVASNGTATATHNDSDLGHWKVAANGLISSKTGNEPGVYLDANNSNIALGQSSGAIYSGLHTGLSSTQSGFYLSNQGLSIGKNFIIKADGSATIDEDSDIGNWRVKKISLAELSDAEKTLYKGAWYRYFNGGNESNSYIYVLNNNNYPVDKDGNQVFNPSTGTFTGTPIYKTKITSKNGTGILLDSNNSKIVLGDGKNGQIYSGSHSSLTAYNATGFYLSSDGLSIGSQVKIDSTGVMKLGPNAVKEDSNSTRYWTIDGNTSNSYIKYGTANSDGSVYIATNKITLGSKFFVSDDGVVRIGSGAAANTSGSKHWTINAKTVGSDVHSYIAYGTTDFNASTSSNVVTINDSAGNSQVYMGTNGIRLGTKFAVDTSGNMLAGFITAKGGKIAGWTINGSALEGEKSNGQYIKLDASGSIEANYSDTSGSESGWKITRSGNAYFNQITANKSGSIGGWSIGANSLTGKSDDDGNKITISANGSISAPNWSISRNGVASFSNVTITSATGKTSKIGGINIGAGLRSSNYSASAGFDINSNGNATFRNTTMTGSCTIGSGNNTISLSDGTLTVKGNITANSLTISGDTQLGSGIKLYGESTSYYLKFGEGTSKHPSVSGLNIGSGGIRLNNDKSGQDYSDIKFISDITAMTVTCATTAGVVTEVKVKLTFKYRYLNCYDGIIYSIPGATADSVEDNDG